MSGEAAIVYWKYRFVCRQRQRIAASPDSAGTSGFRFAEISIVWLILGRARNGCFGVFQALSVRRPDRLIGFAQPSSDLAHLSLLRDQTD